MPGGAHSYNKALRCVGIKKYDVAAELFEESLNGLKKEGKKREYIIALKMVAFCRSKLSDHAGAEVFIKKALEKALEHGLEEELAKIYQSYSIICSHLDKHKEAFDFNEKALSYFPKIVAGKEAEQKEMLEIGKCISLIKLKEYGAAEIKLLELKSRKLVKWHAIVVGEYLSVVYSETGRDREALCLLEDLIYMAPERPSLYMLRAKINGVCKRSGKDCMKAISLCETNLQGIDKEEFRMAYLESKAKGIYGEAIEYFIKAEEIETLFSVIQKTKARYLVEHLPWRTDHQSDPQNLLRPEYPKSKIESIQSLLDNKTACLDMYMMSDKIALFLITDKEYHYELVKISSDDVKEIIDVVIELVRLKLHSRLYKAVIDELYDRVFKNILEKAIKKKVLIIVPHQYFHELSFADFTTHWDLCYLPSLACLKHMKDRDDKFDSCIVLANPDGDLEWSEIEAARVAGHYKKSEVYLKHAAKPDKLSPYCNRFDVLHIAGHAEYNRSNPKNSCVYLSDGNDGRYELNVERVVEQKLKNLKIVVLSCCESGVGHVMNLTDEMISIPRAFLQAGARGVLVTFGNVDDEATHILMNNFHLNLSCGYSPARSLRISQELVRKKFPHPYFWAGFQYIGV